MPRTFAASTRILPRGCESSGRSVHARRVHWAGSPHGQRAFVFGQLLSERIARGPKSLAPRTRPRAGRAPGGNGAICTVTRVQYSATNVNPLSAHLALNFCGFWTCRISGRRLRRGWPADVADGVAGEPPVPGVRGILKRWRQRYLAPRYSPVVLPPAAPRVMSHPRCSDNDRTVSSIFSSGTFAFSAARSMCSREMGSAGSR